MERRFLVSCFGIDTKGNPVFLSFDATLPEGSKMTSNTLRKRVTEIKELQGYQMLLPLTFSEYDKEEN